MFSPEIDFYFDFMGQHPEKRSEWVVHYLRRHYYRKCCFFNGPL